MRKQMIFVFGPESGGTRGATRFLIERGNYWGTDEHIQPLDEFIYGRKPIDNIVPSDVDKIIFRRSVPHANNFEDLNIIDTKFLNAGYKTTWLIVLRDFSEIVRSKVSRQHSLDKTQAWMHTIYQVNWIFERIEIKSSSVFFFPYTTYIKNPDRAADLLKTFKIL